MAKKNQYLEPCPECGQYKYPDAECTKCEVRQEIAFRERLAKSKPTTLPWTVKHGEVNASIYDADGQHIATVFPHCNAKYIMDCVSAMNARAPAVDAAEVERLVDAFGQARADAEEYQVDATAQVAIKARAALIEYVTGKGESRMEWQPIETAPKDGTCLLLYGECAGEIGGPDGSASRVIGRYTDGHSDYDGYTWDVIGGDQYCVWCNPTHWMPLPLPPAPVREGGKG